MLTGFQSSSRCERQGSEAGRGSVPFMAKRNDFSSKTTRASPTASLAPASNTRVTGALHGQHTKQWMSQRALYS